jgi:acyl-CoA synthetase (NDP forming)
LPPHWLTRRILACQEIGFPVVMKVVSPEILHKSDFGGVILNIQDKNTAEHAYAKLSKDARDKSFKGVIVYPMVAKIQEMILGFPPTRSLAR